MVPIPTVIAGRHKQMATPPTVLTLMGAVGVLRLMVILLMDLIPMVIAGVIKRINCAERAYCREETRIYFYSLSLFVVKLF